MADFRQLALEFVLENDEAKLTKIAQRAASEIQAAAPNSNPVARWVEAVQPWMPGSSDNTAMDESDAVEWTSRAKALEFLSCTLDFLSQDTLKPSQLKLLITFFGAMFDVDHKAGIMASATALSRIITAKSFRPQSGSEIIKKVCALADDFPRQVAKTRLAVYQLLHSLITNPAVTSNLKTSYGPDAAFMADLLRLCNSERDPDCLMVWFDTLRYFMANYSPSAKLLEGVYGTFKAYFPITLPRTSSSGVTPDQLKTQLRNCFSANHQLAPFTFPFLLEKLDQGDGVSVNVKLDVLRTLKACVEQYDCPQESVVPYVDRIWNCLKYEVRNGEIEDTIWATLEVLKTVTTRLTGDKRRDYALTVTRDCVADFSSSAYTAGAGRLLVSVMSANVGAFVLMVTPAITHVKENLRHPKSSIHSQHLLKILRVILETRRLLIDTNMTHQDRNDFAAVDTIFDTLYSDVYRILVQNAGEEDASNDDVQLFTEAVEGVGALICQKVPDSLQPLQGQDERPSTKLLLNAGTCLEICNSLFNIARHSCDAPSSSTDMNQLINQAMAALQRAVEAYPPGFKALLARALSCIRDAHARETSEAVRYIRNLASILAFTGCSSLEPSLGDVMRNFLRLSMTFFFELVAAIDAHLDAEIWCAWMAGLQAAAYYLNDACQETSVGDASPGPSLDLKSSLEQESWLSLIAGRYPVLKSLEVGGAAPPDFEDETFQVPLLGTVSEFRQDFLLIALSFCRQLYRRATKPVLLGPQQGQRTLALSDDLASSNKTAKLQYLGQMSDYASFVVAQMNRSGSSCARFENYYLTLFRDDSISVPTSPVSHQDAWLWLNKHPLNVLSLGILKSLLPLSVKKLYDMGIAQQLIIDGISFASRESQDRDLQVMRATLAVLGNKNKLEKSDDLMANIETCLQSALDRTSSESSSLARDGALQQALTIFTLAGSLVRRRTGARTKGLVKLLGSAPGLANGGYDLARGLELVMAPLPLISSGTGCAQNPLWMQKLYVDVVQPMLSASSEANDAPVRHNYGVAVLHMVKHVKFSIYEDDAPGIVRVAIAVLQTAGPGADALAALDVLRTVMVDMPDAIQQHLRSVIDVCGTMFVWPPKQREGRDAQIGARCGKLALEIVGGLPRVYEPASILAFAPAVQRALALACGNDGRELRRTARLARAAWADVK